MADAAVALGSISLCVGCVRQRGVWKEVVVWDGPSVRSSRWAVYRMDISAEVFLAGYAPKVRVVVAVPVARSMV